MVNRNLSILYTLATISFTANAQDNLNNPRVLTIQPGQQTPQANLRHQKYCESIGGTDATNEGKVTLIGDAEDGVLCSMPSDAPAKVGVTPVNPDGSLGTFVPSSSQGNARLLTADPHGLISLIPPSGTIPFQTQAYVSAQAAYYAYFAGPSLVTQSRMSIPADNCGWSIEKTLPTMTRYTATSAIICRALVAGSVVTQMQACSAFELNPLTCKTAIGSMYQPQQS